MAAGGGPRFEQPQPVKSVWPALICAVVLFGLLGMVFCSAENAKKNPTPSPAPDPAATLAPVVMVLENGVVYFELTGDDYLKALQAFYKDNPNLHCDLQGYTEKVVTRAVDSYSATRHTETTGFILHCHDLAIPAQGMTME